MAEPKENPLMEKIVSLCKRRGFVFQSSEIYGGINGFWDYGPLGAGLKRNVKDFWWQSMTRWRDDVVGLEATIIMHPKIWEASGHTTTFADPMVDCLLTKKRYRADQIDEISGIAYHFDGARDLKIWSNLLKSCPEAMRESVTNFVKGFMPYYYKGETGPEEAKLRETFKLEYEQKGGLSLDTLCIGRETFE